jgi:hypothetical protein
MPECSKGVGRYKNESIAGARPSDKIVEMASGVHHTNDLHAIVDDAIKDEISGKGKRAQIGPQLGASATYARVASQSNKFAVSRSMNRSALAGLSSAM